MSMPSIVTTGSIALRRTCERITCASGALRTRGADVVLAQRLEHARAHHPM